MKVQVKMEIPECWRCLDSGMSLEENMEYRPLKLCVFQEGRKTVGVGLPEPFEA